MGTEMFLEKLFLIAFAIANGSATQYRVDDKIVTVSWNNIVEMNKFLQIVIEADKSIGTVDTNVTDLHQNPLSGGTGSCTFYSNITTALRCQTIALKR